MQRSSASFVLPRTSGWVEIICWTCMAVSRCGFGDSAAGNRDARDAAVRGRVT